MVRRIFAAGDIAKIYQLIKKAGVLLGADLPDGLLGPAADMYQLKWSRRLEQVSYEYMETVKDKPKDPRNSIHYKNYIGFFWIGNILNLLKDALEIIPFGKVKDAIKSILEYVEVIVILVWMLITIPKKEIKEGDNFGPAEAIFAERYEIGCWSDPWFSVCFLDRIPFRKRPFKLGPACTLCSTHCEFWQQMDKTIEEGDLCVPPQPHQEKMLEVVTEAAKNSAIMSNMGRVWIFLLILILVLSIRK
ncbi:hypothetical protein GCK72_012016 [Caenorhabditis remanei]|uniref:Uncharacterized protein n=1 Tax=Caenorhabditis remanei TaxID=31234 RepID=A0A6A5GLQ3_CAERE|nr:hypothetical protein GCK72_012016 [Caenorhabditis remanei]KAF1755566.1 hypothetical protein GCK72_012016 [Caenorhabditis remanei]